MQKSEEKVHKKIQKFLSEKTIEAMRELCLIIPGLEESTKDMVMLRNKFLDTVVEDHCIQDYLLFQEALSIYEETIRQISCSLKAIEEEIPK